jgi:hypothetical protein
MSLENHQGVSFHAKRVYFCHAAQVWQIDDEGRT